MRKLIIEKIKKILDKNGFDFMEYHGCFDIVAKVEKIILIKIILNIDSFLESQSENLSSIASMLDGIALVVGNQTRTEKLKENVVYKRFDTYAMNVETFERFIENKQSFILRKRGGLFVRVNGKLIKKGRIEQSLTQNELAEKIGVTKKNIYEHEQRISLMSIKNAEKIEKIIKKNIIIPLDFSETQSKAGEGYDSMNVIKSFEKRVKDNLLRIGFNTKIVSQSPFNIMANKENLIISEAETNEKKIKRLVPYLEKFSELTKKKTLIITDKNKEYETPTLPIHELEEMKNAREVFKSIRKT